MNWKETTNEIIDNLLTLTFVWGIQSFIKIEANVLNWTEDDRISLIGGWIVLTIIRYTLTKTKY